MRLWLGLLAIVLPAPGCALLAGVSERGDVIRHILPSSVQLRAERDGGGRRAASGVVLASDPESGRSWILTTRHFLNPPGSHRVYIITPGRKERAEAVILVVSPEDDLAVIELKGMTLPPVKFKEVVRLGDEVWVVAFPWGRRFTVVSGVVSQIASDEGEMAVEGPPRMVDASVSYGASGGGVFDAASGRLVGIVEGYRTAKVAIPAAPERALEVPVPGETTIISSRAIRHFLVTSGLESLIPK